MLSNERLEELKSKLGGWYIDITATKDLLALIDQAKQPTSDEVKRAIDALNDTRIYLQGRNMNISYFNIAYAIDLAITALRQMQTKPNCSTAEWNGGKCCGYGKAENDDEPIDACKACTKQASYGVE